MRDRGALLSTVTAALAKAGKTIIIHSSAMDRLVAEGYSQPYGARFLKRVIDERGKLPVTLHWRDSDYFKVCLTNGSVVVDAKPTALRYGGLAVA